MNSEEKVVFKGRIGEMVNLQQSDGRVFELFRRPPGTRLIIVSDDGKVLVTKEHRFETGGYDFRLPGGKVCDGIDEYKLIHGDVEKIKAAAIDGAIREAREETGLDIINPELITIANAGSIIEWDLYYYLIKQYEYIDGGQQLEHGEDITVNWMTPAEIRQLIKRGEMNEWRSVGVLLGLVLPDLEDNSI